MIEGVGRAEGELEAMAMKDGDVLCACFRKFTDDGLQTTQVKTSAQRAIKSKLVAQYPYLDETGLIDVLMPKKVPVVLGKVYEEEEEEEAVMVEEEISEALFRNGMMKISQPHVQVVIIEKEPRFFSYRDQVFFPTLRILHRYPEIMNKLRVDRGAIKFVLSGANIMCPGLTSAGATIHSEVEAYRPVAIYAEGKESALAVGLTKLSTREMVEVNKGIAVENIHALGDGLWRTERFV